MCGRFYTDFPWDTLWAHYGLEGPLPPQVLAPRWNIAPGQPVLALCRQVPAGPREVLPLVWGLVPRWSRDPGVAMRLFNARAETVAEKPAFLKPLQRRRCLLPASGWYVWRKARGLAPQPHVVRHRAGALLSLAGLWEQWLGEDGSEIWSCTVLTASASPRLAPLNPRMPLLLQPEEFATWLDPPEKPHRTVLPLLRSAAAREPEGLEALPVGSAVNAARRDAPDCATPVGPPLWEE